MAENFWDTEKDAGEVLHGETNKFKITICTKDNKQYINLRKWYCTKNDPIFKPTKNGIVLPINIAMDIATLIQKAVHEVES